jgi:peroxiredoxin Q/BCP
MPKNTKELVVGDTAPDFALPSTDGTIVTLKALKGSQVVLYFYPKDMTSGCTVEAHEFSELAKKFTKQGVVVFGVSPDSIKSHLKFIEKEGITFPLLSDETKAVCEAYGVWKEKSMYGKKYMGVERSTFVIDEKGKLEQVYYKVKAGGHALCVLEDIGVK